MREREQDAIDLKALQKESSTEEVTTPGAAANAELDNVEVDAIDAGQ